MQQATAAIRPLRQALGLSLRQAADLAGTTAPYLLRVERGERVPSEKWLRNLTGALGRYMAEVAEQDVA